jgi:hypothetical protein
MCNNAFLSASQNLKNGTLSHCIFLNIQLEKIFSLASVGKVKALLFLTTAFCQ